MSTDWRLGPWHPGKQGDVDMSTRAQRGARPQTGWGEAAQMITVTH